MKKKIERILFLNPPRIILKERERKRVDLPLGLAYIAAMLEREGFEVHALDTLLEGFDTDQEPIPGWIRFGMTLDQIAEFVAKLKPDLVGVSNLFSDGFPPAAELIPVVKKVNPEIVTVIGGNHPTAVPEDTLRRSGCDYVVLGEGDYVIIELIRALNRGEDPAGMPGIATLRNDTFVGVRQKNFIEDLDALPLPARHLFKTIRYSEVGSPHGDEIMRHPYTTIITSRGCPARCTYCASFMVHGRHFRPRSVESVLDEIELLVSQGIKEIHFEDDTMAANRTRMLRLCRGILERGIDITWVPTSGIAMYNIDREVLTAMRDSGCYTIWVPVESGDPDVLRMIRKPLPYKRIKSIVKTIQDLGMKAKGFFMYGFPGETKEQMEHTFQFAKDLELDYATFFMATPLPGTKMYEDAKRLNPEFSWVNLKFAKSNLQIGGYSFEEMEQIRKKVWLDVNWGIKEE